MHRMIFRPLINMQYALIVPLWMGFFWPVLAANPPAPANSTQAASAKTQEVLELKWEMLLPEEERLNFEIALPPAHDYLSEQGPAMEQKGSFATNPKLNGVAVRIPGFVVPLSVSQDGLTEFLLVPYFGACIHMPPPPPNQIVYVKMNKGFKLKSLYEPQWVTGVLHTTSQFAQLAATAYTLDGEKTEPFEY